MFYPVASVFFQLFLIEFLKRNEALSFYFALNAQRFLPVSEN